ncbi:MAG: sialate O-acetylesterase [Patescibacteria group bacterium]|nr:sialate O-acetylesterase [Patescibacteria group bacterium]
MECQWQSTSDSRRTPVAGVIGVRTLAGALFLVSIVAQAAFPGIVAWWRFEQDNPSTIGVNEFLLDSSGQGNHLAVYKGGPVQSSDVASGATGGGSAWFDGVDDLLRTVGTLDLSPYGQVRVSWWMRVQEDFASGGTAVPLEHSPTFNTNTSGFLVSVNENIAGGPAGAVGYKTTATGYNIDRFSHATPDATHPAGQWQQMAVEFDRTTSNAAKAVRVWRNGEPLPDEAYAPAHRSTSTAPFRNDFFSVGGRSDGIGSYFFRGNMDEVVIEGLNQPTGPIAYWRFEPDNLLADSSGNGHTLVNVNATSSSDVASGANGEGSVAFNGTNAYLKTAAALDLRPYRRVRLSYWQKVEGTTSGMVWEHSSNFINKPGAIVADVNDGGVGNGKAGVWGNGSAYNLDDYPHAVGQWQQVAVEFNLDGVAPDVSKVYVNGRAVSSGTAQQTTNLSALINDTFYMGARGGSSVFLQGKIDELKIEQFDPKPLKVFVLAGQSNMMGQYAYNADLPAELQGNQPAVLLRHNGVWTVLKPGHGVSSTQFGPEVTFGHDMDAAWGNADIALVKYAVGATTLAVDWNSQTPGTLYNNLLTTVNTAMSELSAGYDAELAGMIWMQGESDGLNAAYAAAYEDNLRQFIASIRDDLGEDNLPFVLAQISEATAWTHGDVVRAAQWDVGNSMFNTRVFSTADLPLYSNHYNAAGQMELGSRFATAMLTMVPEPSAMLLAGLGVIALLARSWRGGRRGPCPARHQ